MLAQNKHKKNKRYILFMIFMKMYLVLFFTLKESTLILKK